MIGVYGIFHTPSGKSYVGSSGKLKNRLRGHLKTLTRGSHVNPLLQQAWVDPTEWEVVILEQCDRGELLDREQHWIDSLDSGFNRTKNAFSPALDPLVAKKIGNSNRGRKNPALVLRNKVFKWMKGKKHRPESIAKMSASTMGMKTGPASEERKRKVAEALRGVPLTAERRAAISKARKGKPLTEKMKLHLKKLHESMRGKAGHAHSEETKAKMSASRMGRISAKKGTTSSEETKRKVSESLKAYYARKRGVV
jgi:group I intron endonuclease